MFRVILLLSLLIAGLRTQAQVNLNQQVQVMKSDSTIDLLLNSLSDQYNLYFTYNKNKINGDQPHDLIDGIYSVQEILDHLRSQHQLEYSTMSKQIVLKPHKDRATLEPKFDQDIPPPSYTLSGTLKEAATGEVLIGGTVLVKSMGTGVVSNTYGFYSITLPEGEYEIEFGFFGMEDSTVQIQLTGDLNIDIGFKPTLLDLVEVVVDAKPEHERLANVSMSSLAVDAQSRDITPGATGEIELIKSLQDVAGITGHGDGSVYYYVRGGGKDQNLILLDEAPIYNTSHLFGFFSSFSHHAIKEAKLHKADIPIEHGGMLSSFLDIQTRDGNNQKFSGFGNHNPFASTLSIEGPIRKERSSYFLLARRSHINWLTGQAGGDFMFSDFNFKLNFKPTDRDRVFFNLFAGKDRYSTIGANIGTVGISWQNFAGTLRWNHIVNERLFTNTTLYSSHYQYWLYTSYPDEFWLEQIINASLRSDWSFYYSPEQTWRFGMEAKAHQFNPGNFTSDDEELNRLIPDLSLRKANHMVFYFGNEHELSDRLKVNYGLRSNKWINIGESTIYEFDDEYNVTDTVKFGMNERFGQNRNLEPRVSARYILDSISTFKASYGRNVQYLQLLSNSTSPFTNLDVWMPSGPNLAPQIADQFVFGYYRDMWQNTWELTSEVYYKLMQNQIDYEDHANLLLNPLLEGEVRQVKGNAFGWECTLEKKTGRLTGTASYNLSRTRFQSPLINNGTTYRPYFDRPHDFVLNLQWKGKKRWVYGLRWQYTSGMAFTSPVGWYNNQGITVPYYGDRNNDRLPDYHRLDLTGTWIIQDNPEKRFKHYLSLSIYNLYNRKNAVAINFNKISNNDEIQVPVQAFENYTYTVAQMSVLGLMPAINYTFKF